MRPRQTLRDRDIFRWIMKHPGRGTPYSVRSLAQVVGCSPATIGHLLSGERSEVRPEIARSVSEALGVAPLILFAPIVSLARDEVRHAADDKDR